MDTTTITTDALEGVIIPAEGGPSELVLLQRDPESVFLDEPFLKALLAQITARATDFTPDISTDKGRKQIASMAYRVSQTKTYLDGIGKDLVAELKDRPRKIDAGRKLLRDGLDALRDHVRQALNEWEAEQARQQIVLDGIRRMPADHTGSNADQLRQVIQRLEGQESTIPGAQEARDEAIATLRDMLAKREVYEAEQAELARFRQQEADRKAEEERERLRREGEERARRDAEEAAARAEQAQRDAERRAQEAEESAARERQEAQEREVRAREEAAAEERRRQEEAKRKEEEAQAERDRDQANRKKVLHEALEDCMTAAAVDDEHTRNCVKSILLAICANKVRHTRITF